ncbi:MAG: hypothetical protein RQ875_14375, partial [Vicingaceae bacterium]|nr:hypothetical protein [Vicingaceae bacterium]
SVSNSNSGSLYSEVMNESLQETISYNGGSPEQYYERMSKELINRHGKLVQVDFSSAYPDYEIYFAYEDERRIYSGSPTGNYDIHSMTLGYLGEGSRYAKHFLASAGFDISDEQINSIKPGDSLRLENEIVVIQKKKDKVNEKELGSIKFSHEENKEIYGFPATYRYYVAPDLDSAMLFLNRQEITTQHYYVVVETPEGNVSKDRMGIY